MPPTKPKLPTATFNFVPQRRNLRAIKVYSRCWLLRAASRFSRDNPESEVAGVSPREHLQSWKKRKKQEKEIKKLHSTRTLTHSVTYHARDCSGVSPSPGAKKAAPDLTTISKRPWHRRVKDASVHFRSVGVCAARVGLATIGPTAPVCIARTEPAPRAAVHGCSRVIMQVRLAVACARRDRRPTLSVDCRCRLPWCNTRAPRCCCRCARRVAAPYARASADRRIYYIKPNAISGPGMTGQRQVCATAAPLRFARASRASERPRHARRIQRSLINPPPRQRIAQRASHRSFAFQPFHLYRSPETTVLFSVERANAILIASDAEALLFYRSDGMLFYDEYDFNVIMI